MERGLENEINIFICAKQFLPDLEIEHIQRMKAARPQSRRMEKGVKHAKPVEHTYAYSERKKERKGGKVFIENPPLPSVLFTHDKFNFRCHPLPTDTLVGIVFSCPKFRGIYLKHFK